MPLVHFFTKMAITEHEKNLTLICSQFWKVLKFSNCSQLCLAAFS